MIQLVTGFVLLLLVATLLTTLCVKFFERRLLFSQALVISGAAWVVGLPIVMIYYFNKAQFDLSSAADGLVIIIDLFLVGTLITRQSKMYGYPKQGWLGVGGKSMFGLLVLSWTFVGLAYGVSRVFD